jgi:hypothetical protein
MIKIHTEVSDITVGDIIEHEGYVASVYDVECDAVDTYMGATYLYRLYIMLGPDSEDEITKFDGETVTVLKPEEVV